MGGDWLCYNMGLVIALASLCLSALAEANSKAITTSLTTKWFSAPLLLEASEFLAEDSQEKFWSFVEASQNIGSSDHHDTHLSYYNSILEAAFQFLSPLQQNLLKFSLSLRSYSASIQSFQQIAVDEPPPEGCKSFFSVHGKQTCDFDALETLLLTAPDRPKPLLFKGDHRYPSSNSESPVVIFYSEIGHEEFSNIHHQLTSKSKEGKINYVFRHYISNPRKEPVYLSGYGVELAIKSTEYKAKDDTQVKGTEVNTTVIGENDPIDEVQGFLFGRLRELYPTLEGQLKEFRKHLVESTNEMAPLKVWQLQDLSFQTAARILAAPVELALVVMKDISQNFPTKARAITKTAVSSQLRTEVEENQKYFKGTIGLQPGDSALFINGLHIDLDTQDIFSLFDTLRNEARVMEGLHSLGIEGLSLHNILKLNIQPSETDYAVDIRSPAISVFIVDPVHETTAELISIAEMFLSNHIPLRIGFIFVVNDSEDVDGMQDAGVAVLRAYNYVVQEVDGYHAFQTLTHIYNKVRTGEKVKVEHVVSVLQKKYPYVEVNSILGIDSAYDQNRKEARGYYEQTGVGPLPVILFNGMPLEKEQLDPDELETITMHKILETTTFFQRAVYLECPPRKSMKTSNNVRISMINNPSQEISYANTPVFRAIWAALQTQTSNSAKNFITKMAKEETAEALAAGADIGEFSVGGMDVSLFKEAFESSKMDFILSHALYCRDVLKLKKGQRVVISNGRIIGPLEESELFNQDDFHLLENIILKTSGQKIKSHIQQLRVEEDV
ncbi:hypothetical protein STEG23_009455, partial [Scotinomys teguina]